MKHFWSAGVSSTVHVAPDAERVQPPSLVTQASAAFPRGGTANRQESSLSAETLVQVYANVSSSLSVVGEDFSFTSSLGRVFFLLFWKLIIKVTHVSLQAALLMVVIKPLTLPFGWLPFPHVDNYSRCVLPFPTCIKNWQRHFCIAVSCLEQCISCQNYQNIIAYMELVSNFWLMNRGVLCTFCAAAGLLNAFRPLLSLLLIVLNL